MIRPALAALSALFLVSACEGTGGSGTPVVDPNPQAPLGEAISSPTDGFENEIEA